MKIINVSFMPSTTRFRIIPKLLSTGFNCRYWFYEYSFLSCRWLVKKRLPKDFYKNYKGGFYE